MNKCLSLVHLITITLVTLHMASAQSELPQARIVNLSIDPEQVVVLHVRPGYVSSVRVLEEVSSVVLVTREPLRPSTPKPSRNSCFSKQQLPSPHKRML